MKKLIAISLASVALVAGFSTPARADHRETIIGAVIGTTVGGVVGREIGGRNGTLVGAVIGAATGATIGRDVGYHRSERVVYEEKYYPDPVEYYPEPPRPPHVIVRHPPDRVIIVRDRDHDDCDREEWRHRHHRDRDDWRHDHRHWD